MPPSKLNDVKPVKAYCSWVYIEILFLLLMVPARRLNDAKSGVTMLLNK